MKPDPAKKEERAAHQKPYLPMGRALFQETSPGFVFGPDIRPAKSVAAATTNKARHRSITHACELRTENRESRTKKHNRQKASD